LKQIAGIWLPEHEEHLVDFLEDPATQEDGVGTYQRHKYRLAMKVHRALKKPRRRAIDVGGHVGLWSRMMAKDFDKVTAFEPVREHQECFRRNVRGMANVELHEYALGRIAGFGKMVTSAGSSGDTHIELGGSTWVKPLDDWGFDNVDFLKIDCEGYELEVLRGAAVMLTNSDPTVIVEQKPGRAQRYDFGETEAVDYLQTLDYELWRAVSGDYIMVRR
jgi:FkbM family methyltransferase